MTERNTVNPALEEAESSHLVSHEDYLAAVEAVLMVAEEPVTPAELATAVNLPQHQVQALLDELRAEADGVVENWPGDAPMPAPRQRGYELREVAGGWRYYSRARYAEQVSVFVLDGQTSRLSPAALETLAVIAYRQPVARSAVAAIRGVNVDGVVRSLVQRGLLDTAGTDPVTGATLYVTTPEFLERLGLDSIEELPKLSPHLPGVEELDNHDAA
ncbi:SMC-Scp complex subunit ScpB [Nesterenkonia ebinurensis]|uniref:SMC-Scp complex subunit ScpB n=1 Tax=Nesterenkonia ebinurensis TaxID=2608252 RepID=UPI00123DB256|nr:SMC-Scp complex subunit ScpB [Nesterenkonia ebinurensis]